MLYSNPILSYEVDRDEKAFLLHVHLQEKGMKKPGTDCNSTSGYVMVSILFNDPDKREII